MIPTRVERCRQSLSKGPSCVERWLPKKKKMKMMLTDVGLEDSCVFLKRSGEDRSIEMLQKKKTTKVIPTHRRSGPLPRLQNLCHDLLSRSRISIPACAELFQAADENLTWTRTFWSDTLGTTRRWVGLHKRDSFTCSLFT